MGTASEARRELEQAQVAFNEESRGVNDQSIEWLLTAVRTLVGAVAALESAGKEPGGADCARCGGRKRTLDAITRVEIACPVCNVAPGAPEAGRSACDCPSSLCRTHPLGPCHCSKCLRSGPAHQPEAKPAPVTREELAEALRRLLTIGEFCGCLPEIPGWQDPVKCKCGGRPAAHSATALLARLDKERAP